MQLVSASPICHDFSLTLGLTGIPLGLWLAFWCKWQLSGLWTGLAASTAYSTVVAAILLVRSNWAVDIAHLDENASTDLANESQVPQEPGHTEVRED